MTKEELERFNERTRRLEKGCVVWIGHRDRDGYGIFWFRRYNRRAHRVAYWNSVGDIPKGYVIDHICKNPWCVRVDHLRCITPRENTLAGGGFSAINAKKTHCKMGHPFDRTYNNARYCSICERAKRKRLRAKWNKETKRSAKSC